MDIIHETSLIVGTLTAWKHAVSSDTQAVVESETPGEVEWDILCISGVIAVTLILSILALKRRCCTVHTVVRGFKRDLLAILRGITPSNLAFNSICF